MTVIVDDSHSVWSQVGSYFLFSLASVLQVSVATVTGPLPSRAGKLACSASGARRPPLRTSPHPRVAAPCPPPALPRCLPALLPCSTATTWWRWSGTFTSPPAAPRWALRASPCSSATGACWREAGTTFGLGRRSCWAPPRTARAPLPLPTQRVLPKRAAKPPLAACPPPRTPPFLPHTQG